MHHFTTIVLLLLVLQGCTEPEDHTAWQEIKERDVNESLYRIKVPTEWVRVNPKPGESIADTKKPLCEFYLVEGGEKIRITIHNFPVENIENRIPPPAQVSRWKRQFDHLKESDFAITPIAFSGYEGLRFEGRGILEGRETYMLGWSMQVAPEHFHTLAALNYPLQSRADVTIKATGPLPLTSQHRESILKLATSFELINEIPMRQ